MKLFLNKIKDRLFGKNEVINSLSSVSKEINISCLELNEDYYSNCKLLKNREMLLEQIPNSGIAAEIGVDTGGLSEVIIQLNKPKKLYLIDNWNTERYSDGKKISVQLKFEKEIENGTIEIMKSDSITAASKFNDKYFDWIYIDTDHSYKTTFAELETFRLKIRDGGIIAGHDFCEGNVKASIKYGVREAVYEFCIKYNWEIIFLTMELNIKPSFAIRKKIV